MPKKEPMIEPRAIGPTERFTSSLLGRTLRRVICLVLAKPASTSVESLLRKISLKPNSPSAKATNEIPSWRVLKPKVKRISPLVMSDPAPAASGEALKGHKEAGDPRFGGITLGTLTPPMGLQSFIASDIAEINILEIDVWYFTAAILIIILVVAFIPGVATFLPRLLM